MLVSDLRHYLDIPDDAPGPAKRLGSQLEAIVRAASAHPTGSGTRSAVGCMRRPGRRPCDGFVMIFRCRGVVESGEMRIGETALADLPELQIETSLETFTGGQPQERSGNARPVRAA